MSSTEQNISATSVTADSANIGAINSGSITNTNGIKTDSLGVEGSALIGGNLSVNGAAEIMGALNAHGGISFNNVAFIRDGGDFSVNGTLTTTNGANFGNESIIGVDTWTQDIHGKDIFEGVISAQNLRAANRIFVGDSPFEINAISRKLLADTFEAVFAKVVAAQLKATNATIANLTIADGLLTNFKANNAEITGTLTAAEIQVQSFTAISEFYTKGLTVDGSATISGGVTINGAGRNEGALVVNNFPAVFNHGVRVYHKAGVVSQTLSIIGTTDTEGTGNEETAANKYALTTAIGVRSKFQGDVFVQDSNVVLDNSTLLAEKILVTPISIPVDNADTLQILKSGDGFDVHAEKQLTYASETTDDEDIAGCRTSDEIRTRAAQPYVGKAVDITSPVNALANARARAKEMLARKQARAISVAAMTKAFKVKSGNAEYRLDAGGNVLLKKAIIEQVQASKLSANEIVADTFRTNNFAMDNVAVQGVVTAKEGASIGDAATNTGTSEVYGDVYNYANNVHKDESTVEFQDQATAKFADNTTLKVADGAALIVDDGACASLHGQVEIDLSKLVLFNSVTGRRYHLVLRDAIDAEGDEPGDIALEFGEIKEETPAPVASNEEGMVTQRKATLRADLAEFQAKLKRI